MESSVQSIVMPDTRREEQGKNQAINHEEEIEEGKQEAKYYGEEQTANEKLHWLLLSEFQHVISLRNKPFFGLHILLHNFIVGHLLVALVGEQTQNSVPCNILCAANKIHAETDQKDSS